MSPKNGYNAVTSKLGGIELTTPSNKITLIIADDEPVVRAGIRTMLSQADDIEVIGEAQDGFEAQRMVAKLLPTVLLLDLKMPGLPPAELEKWVRENCHGTVTLVLTAHHREVYLADMMEAGAAGYLKKDISTEVLINSIRNSAGGIFHFSKDQIAEVARWKEEVGKKWENLSEREVLKWLARGAQNRFIARELFISVNTVESHVKSILAKLDKVSRQKAAMWLAKNFPEEVQADR